MLLPATLREPEIFGRKTRTKVEYSNYHKVAGGKYGKYYKIAKSVPLQGEVRTSGAKNSAVAIIPATVLASGPCVLENVPPLTDVRTQCEILSCLGADIQWLDTSTVRIDPRGIQNLTPPEHLASQLRASYYLMGAMLGRFGQAKIGLPGGCKIGPRPIDQHLKGFQALGCSWSIDNGNVSLQGAGMGSGNVYFDLITVGATINVMLAAAGVEEPPPLKTLPGNRRSSTWQTFSIKLASWSRAPAPEPSGLPGQKTGDKPITV